MSSKSTRALRRHQVNSAAFRRQLRFEMFEARNLMAVYEVSSLDDSGPNTLRQAIVDANASAGDDSVVFNLLGSSPLTITLNSQIDVTDSVTVDGTTFAPGIKVSGGNSTRLFSVASGISFTIDTLTLSNGFTAGSGAAIYNLGTTIVSRSTFSGNHSLDDGGAIKNDGTLVDISNSTFSGNIASNDGGAIRNAGTLTIQDSTFANNQAGVAGGGVRNDGTLNITNTIVSSNIASLSGPDLFGTIVSGGYNLIESTNSLTVTGTTTGNILGTGALLGPLGDYGGPTQTHPISANSPAYNAGDPTVVTSDQRGQARIGTPDIGAFESERNRFFVTTNADSGVGTLRQAIADANFFTGTDTVLFKLGGPIAVISPVSALPSITESLVLDGTSQTGYAGSPLIELDGSNIVAAENGLYVNSSGSTIRGLSIVNWSFAGVIFNGSNNKLQSSYIGVHANGTTAGGSASGGVWVYVGSNNVIGTDGDGLNDTSEGNVISGNSTAGVYIQDASLNNVVAGNIIGLNAAGTAALGTQQYGVWMFNDAVDGTRIGTDGNGVSDAIERNVISGNTDYGVRVDGADHSIIAGNLIGTNAAGTSLISSAQSGISLGLGTDHTLIGTNADGTSDSLERNVIVGGTGNLSGNNFGIALSGAGTTLNTIAGNYIGVGPNGSTVMANDTGVVLTFGASNNTIGGGAAGAGNVIAGNSQDITITSSGTDSNRVQGNRISMTANGLSLIAPTFGYGIYIANGANDNFVGTDSDGNNDATEGNLIGFASTAAVFVQDAGAAPDGTIIAGNHIGLDANGGALSSGARGIWIQGATNTRIGSDANGTSDDAERNVIVPGTNMAGIFVTDGSLGDTAGTTIAGNYIGVNVAGLAGLSSGPNSAIAFQSSGTHLITGNTIGGTSVASRNVISSTAIGIDFSGADISGNTISGNYIGTDKNGTNAIANGTGIRLSDGAHDNTIGTAEYGRSTLSSNGELQTTYGLRVGPNGDIYTATNGSVVLGNNGGILRIDHVTGVQTVVTRGNGVDGPLQHTTDLAFEASGDIVATDLSTGGVALGIVRVNATTGAQTRISDFTNAGQGPVITYSVGIVVEASGDFVVTSDDNTLYRVDHLTGNRTVVSTGGQLDFPYGLAIEANGNILATSVSKIIRINPSNGSQSIVSSGFEQLLFLAVGTDGTIYTTDSGNGISIPTAVYRVDPATGVKSIVSTGTNDGRFFNGIAVEPGGSLITDLVGATDGDPEFLLRLTPGAARNVISGNSGNGIEILGSATALPGDGTGHNVVIGNYVGTDSTGLSDLGNGGVGVYVTGSIVGRASYNRIGGTTFGERNVISGNNGMGVQLYQAIVGTVVAGNYVGVDATGNTALGNTTGGVFTGGFENASNTIGGILPGAGNLISGNSGWGMDLGGDGNRVQGNIIGLNASGASAVPNLGRAINSFGAFNFVIGGDDDDDGTLDGIVHARNIISGNSEGVTFEVADTLNGTIQGNYFGTDITGQTLISNLTSAIALSGASGMTIGGLTAGAGNVINGTSDGITLSDRAASVTDWTIQGNIIGLAADGVTPLQIREGIFVWQFTPGMTITDVTIGGTTTNARNVISRGVSGINLTGSGISDVSIQGNYIGTDASGTLARPNSTGVYLNSGAHDNTIGGTTAGERNVISGNNSGVEFSGSSTSGNVVIGNYVGTNVAGSSALANVLGISLKNGAHDNTIGGTTSSERNIISGNSNYGIYLLDSGTQNNTISGNYVGTNPLGNAAIANGTGIVLTTGASSNTIGGSATGAGNLISGNTGSGVYLSVNGTNSNVIAGNLIGTNAAGATSIPNGINGVSILGGSSNRIGGSTAVERNIISGNARNGIEMTGAGTNSNIVIGNYIGINAAGTARLRNDDHGVLIDAGAQFNRIGTDGDNVNDTEERNVISGNGSISQEANINIFGGGTDHNIVAGNYVGTAASGASTITNGGRGIRVAGNAAFNQIGTDGSNDAFNSHERNIVSGNPTIGIFVAGASNDNVIAGNWVGLNAAGTASLGNGADGISISTSQRTRVGTNADGIADADEANVVVGSGGFTAVMISDPGSQNNVVAGNFIGTNPTGTALLGIQQHGVTVANDAHDNRVGGVLAAERNIIAGSSVNGIYVVQFGAFPTGYNTTIQGNYIGTDVTGTIDFGNGGDGIKIERSYGNTIGGTTTGAGNLISGNTLNGIEITGAASINNSVVGNLIGTDLTGNVAIANASGVSINTGATNNTIGGATAGARNIISGNTGNGIDLNGATTLGNVIQGNYIGTNAVGAAALANFGAGISSTLAGLTLIGTNADGVNDVAERNVISGNLGNGVNLLYSNVNGGTTIAGNYIGTNANGSAAIPNSRGIVVTASMSNTIGGTATTAGNLISGNGFYGVEIVGTGAVGNTSVENNVIQGNRIGTNASGLLALPNGTTGPAAGVRVESAEHVLVGGTSVDARNVISGNIGDGINVVGGQLNTIQGNYVGTNAAGTADLGNSIDGVRLSSQNNTIGGTTSGAGNVISGNNHAGLEIGGVSNNTLVYGNLIGTDASGTVAIGNTYFGILVQSSFNQIGGPTAAHRNVVSGTIQNNGLGDATGAGIAINDAGFITVTGNNVQGNYVGTDVTGSSAIPNHTAGVIITTPVAGNHNTIGGSNPGEGNVISGNGDPNNFVSVLSQGAGIVVNSFIGPGVSQPNVATILGNKIGTDTTGSFAVPNLGNGIFLVQSPSNHVGGSSSIVNGILTGSGNLISGNLGSGIVLDNGGSNSDGTVIQGNFIGTDLTGSKAIGNGIYGVAVGTSNNVLGGTNAGFRNLVSGNNFGIGIGFGGTNNQVIGNYVGTDISGQTAIQNKTFGVWIGTNGNSIGGSDPNAGNIIANSGQVGLKLENATADNGTYLNNTYFGNLGLAIDAGPTGRTTNDTPDLDGVVNYPEISSTEILGNDLIVIGIVPAGKTVSLYVSAPSANGAGQGRIPLATVLDDSIADEDNVAGQFRIRIPLSNDLNNGTALTALTNGSTSEFSPIVFAGEVGSYLAPQITLSQSTVSIASGSSINIDGSFYDSDSLRWEATVDYGDGSGEKQLALNADKTFRLEHTYANTGNFTATIVVRDATLNASSKTVAVVVQNQAPTANFNLFTITSPATEGQLIQLTGQFEDTSGSYSATIDWGDGTSSVVTQTAAPAGQIVSLGNNKFEIRATHNYRDDFNAAGTATASDVYRVVVTVTDGAGVDATPTGLFLEEISNVLPSNLQVNLNSLSISEGQVVSLSGSFIDPGLDDTHTIVVDWGDGTQSIVSLPASTTSLRSFSDLPALQHVYANDPSQGDDNFTISVSVADDDQPESPVVAERILAVQNVVPFGLTLNASSLIIQENGTILLNGSFTDPGLLDSHIVKINWGDGSSMTNLNLPAGQGTFSGIEHLYHDNLPGGGSYNITVSVADKDTPASANAVLPIQVLNATPLLGSVIVSGSSAPISEGQELTITGSYTDLSQTDTHSVTVQWGDSTSSIATIDPITRTFTATHVYQDNGAVGVIYSGPGPHPVGQFVAEIVVTLADDDAATASTSLLQRVDNVAPSVAIAPAIDNNDSNFIRLIAQSDDAGQLDTVTINWEAFPAGIVGAPVQLGSGSSFTVDRSAYPNSVWRVRAVASDDDGGSFAFETALLVGTNVADNIVINDSTFTSAGVDKLLILGLAGNDTIDGTQVTTSGNQLILDGGDGVDSLFGGAGNDIYYLWRGDDNANVPVVGGPTPVELGNDSYKLKPNSVLTVYDRSGENTLDFGLANYGDSSGITFDLDVANSPTLVQQDVSISQPAAHYVSTLGTFSGLVGSNFSDRLTAASNSKVEGGEGSDQLTVKAGTVGAILSGGADDDTLTTNGFGIANLNFGGDDGRDTLINSGSIAGLLFQGGADDDILTNDGIILSLLNFGGDSGIDQLVNRGTIASIDFSGGADQDLLQNSGSITGLLSFLGDEGVDAFLNAGSVASLTFRGGADDDVFINNGAIPTRLSFIGDNDILLAGSGTIATLNFSGDDGADIFVNLNQINSLTFSGGADDDLFINHGATSTTLNFGGDDDLLVGMGMIGALNFHGDTGADELRNLGTITDLTFSGGADDDLLANTGTIASSLNFGGDNGIDGLFNTGSIASLTFLGGSDDDILINNGPASTTIHFGGDDDQLTGIGSIANLNFGGDDGADLLVNMGNAGTIIFMGGADDDRFVNAGTLSTSLSFGGDNDILVSGAGIVGTLNFGGDQGSDVVQNSGEITNLTFGGGADDDVVINQGTILGALTFGGDDDLLISTAGISSLSFGGDSGTDTLINLASIGSVNFAGGGDDDLIRNNGSISGLLNFGGDDGSDILINNGSLAEVLFNGGADDDILANVGQIHSTLSFGGDEGADRLQNSGTIASLIFGGGADDDVLVNRGSITGGLVFGGDDDILVGSSSVSFIHFSGDEGADTLVNLGSVGSLLFGGGADNDRLENTGTVLGSLSFQGDDGADALVNRGSAGTIFFTGGADDDILFNTATIGSLTFVGGSDDDVLSNNGSTIPLLNFQGDSGDDVLLNNGSVIAALTFTGGADDDVLISNGKGIGSIVFTGDSGTPVVGQSSRDTLILRGSGDSSTTSSVLFEGGYDADAFENNASGFATITFLGGADGDALLNNASTLNSLNFVGDSGEDVLVNHGASIGSLTFAGGADDDILVNDGESIVTLTFNGGADEDLLINSGHQLGALNFSGGADDDIIVNSGNSIGSLNFSGGADDDLLINDGAYVASILFGGDQDLQIGQNGGNDRLWNRKTAIGVGAINYTGDDGADVLVNDAVAIGLINFTGDGGSDAVQNNGQVDSLTFTGGADQDFLINAGSITTVQFSGGADDDTLVNRGARIDTLNFQGDDGIDSLLNIGAVGTISFEGGADGDTLQNTAEVSTLNFYGDVNTLVGNVSSSDDGADSLVNNAAVGSLRFEGGADDDLLQNNSSVGALIFLGGADNDSLINNGNAITLLSFVGDDGADTLINSGSNLATLSFVGGADSDTLRVSGRLIGDVQFTGGSGADSFTYNAVGTSNSTVQFNGDAGDDFFAMRGVATNTTFRGGLGNDQAMVVGTGAMDLNGQEGNDYITFVSSPTADVLLSESYSGSNDTSSDTLDFSSFSAGAINLDLRLNGVWQTQGAGQLRIQLTDGMSIENIIGTSFADTIYGNPRSNYIGGADFDEPFTGTVAAPRGVTQWVYLDFDTYSNTQTLDINTGFVDSGEHIYTATERDAIRQQIELVYRGPNVGAPWFDVRVVNSLSDIPSNYRTNDQFATIFFNRTPTSGRPGGLASEIDPGNTNLGGFAYAQISGLLGGVITGIEALDEHQEDHGDVDPLKGDIAPISEVEVGATKPSGTSSNFIKLSAKIAAHELGHLLGLRHQDAFGPIGLGIHDPPGAGAYKPQYSGPAGGFETFDHLIGSPASIGSDRFNDLNNLFFGEREAVKLAFAGADPAATVRPESATSHNTLATADALSPAILSVANTLTSGLNRPKDFFVQLASITGQIDVDASTGRSQSDWYSFTGRAGELINIDLLSNSLQRNASGLDGTLTSDDFVDSIIRVWHIVAGQAQLVPYFDGVAENDDIFEPTDSSLVDLRLPADGTYFIEVDTFHRYGDTLGDPQNPLSPVNPSNPNNILGDPERAARFLDSINDTDTGKYQLILYKFRKANSSDGIDTLKGFGGVDIIVGGAGENYALAYTLGDSELVNEGTAFNRSISLFDPAASDWSASTVDFGDGTGVQPLVVSSTGVFNLNHVFDDSGSYAITVTIVDDIGQTLTRTLGIVVNNVAPTAILSGSTIDYGDSATASLSGVFDTSTTDTTAGIHYAFSLNSGDLASITYANSASNSSVNLSGLAVGSYSVYAKVIDKDGGYSQYTTTINVLPRLLTVTADARTKVYGDADPTLTYSFGTLFNGDTSSVFTGSLSRTAGQNVGSYAISQGTLTAGANYSIVYAEANLAITPRSLTVTADAKTKIYGDADPTLTYSLGTLFNGDTSSVFTGSLSRAAGQNVGSYPISQGTLTAGANYSIVYAEANLAITPRSLTVSANSRTKIYGDADPTLTYIYSPLFNGDTSSVFVGSLSRDAGENVGNYNITQGTLNAGANYSITYIGTILTITAAPLTVTANAQNKLVGQIDPALTYQVSGLKFSDTIAGTVTGSLARQPGEVAGVYNILQGTLTANTNYTVVYVGSTLTISGAIVNNPPTVAISTPTDGFMNVASTFVLTATDPDAVDQAGVYTYLINWGNGATTTVTGSRTKTVSYSYPAVSSRGQFQITVKVTDPRGAVSSIVSKAFVVGGWNLMADPVNTGKAILVLVGSQGSDSIKLKLRDDDYYKVRIVDRDEDVQRRGTVHGDVDRILVFAFAGNDQINIDDDINDSAEIWGGAGDDNIKGGSGNDIIMGESGDDNLWGGDGRDIVIGGLGADRLHGDANDDILIAGFTMYESDFAMSAPSGFGVSAALTLEQQRTALEAVLAEWTSSRTYATRRQNIFGTGTGTRNNGSYFFKISNTSMTQNTVFDDAAVDRLWGDSGTDWFFANTLGDLGNVLDDIRDRSSSELTEDLDKWW